MQLTYSTSVGKRPTKKLVYMLANRCILYICMPCPVKRSKILPTNVKPKISSKRPVGKSVTSALLVVKKVKVLIPKLQQWWCLQPQLYHAVSAHLLTVLRRTTQRASNRKLFGSLEEIHISEQEHNLNQD